MKYNIFNAMKWVGLVGYVFTFLQILISYLVTFSFNIPLALLSAFMEIVSSGQLYLFLLMFIIGVIFAYVFRPKGVNMTKVAKG